MATWDGWEGAETAQKRVNFAPPNLFHDLDGPDPGHFKPQIRPKGKVGATVGYQLAANRCPAHKEVGREG